VGNSLPENAQYALLPPGRPRVAVSLQSRVAFSIGLSIYKPSRPLAKALLNIFKFVGPTLTGIVLKILDSVSTSQLPTDADRYFEQAGQQICAVYFGSPGETNSISVKTLDSQNNVEYAKIAVNATSAKYLQNEYSVITKLSELEFVHFHLPEILGIERLASMSILTQNSLGEAGLKQAPYNAGLALLISKEISIKKSNCQKLMKANYFLELSDRVKATGIDWLKQAISQIEQDYGECELLFGLNHGDFTPWNILQDGKRIYVIDWEWSRPSVPVGYDLCHYEHQSAHNLNIAKKSLPYESGSLINLLNSLAVDETLAPLIYALYAIDWICFEILESRKHIDTLGSHSHALCLVIRELKK
jgi:hypothetical protein